MTIPLRPFFSYYGSSWRKARLYPQPVHDTIVEPFAGSLGYSCHYWDHQVIAGDLDDRIVALWQYLIGVSADELSALPDIESGQPVSSLGLAPGAEWLIRFNLGRTQHDPPDRVPERTIALRTTREYRGAFWTPYKRDIIAGQLGNIRHWRVAQRSYQQTPSVSGTFIVDPPYQNKGRYYRHGSKDIDYAHLADWCRSRPGQVIVMEQEGADWLPFEPLASVKSQVKGRRSSEVVWTKGPTAIQQRMFG